MAAPQLDFDMLVDEATCNRMYPLLVVSPSFGEGMRSFVDDEQSHAHAHFLDDKTMRATVNWGGWREGNESACRAQLSVRGLGRRPANTELAVSEVTFQPSQGEATELVLEWKVGTPPSAPAYPEYLVELEVWKQQQSSNGLAREEVLALKRTQHALPPISALDYNIRDILWAPGLYAPDANAAANSPAAFGHAQHPPPQQNDAPPAGYRRRGFGLELETVQLPPNPDVSGCFSKLDEFHAAVRKIRDRPDGADIPKAQWDRLLKWVVCHDCQVQNATPVSRIDLHRKCIEDGAATLNPATTNFILGGDKELLGHPSFPDLERVSLASPEYNSPAPPNELFYEFGASDGAGASSNTAAEDEIRLLLDRVIKHPTESVPIHLPTVSAIGQSSSSIHVHVNVRNPAAWPRTPVAPEHDFEDTLALLAVVANWIRFDGVIRQFAQPWMWRERSLAPMFAAGPEFLWREVAWKQNTSAVTFSEATAEKGYNVPAFFKHAFETLHAGTQTSPAAAPAAPGTEANAPGDAAKPCTSVFDNVFSYDAVHRTLFRNNALNLLALGKFGTVEFRRMHATLDADFVVAWTRFCVAFVEKFIRNYDRFGKQYFDAPGGWQQGHARLVQAQNEATLEELVEIMTEVEPSGRLLDADVFRILTSSQ